MTHPDVEIFWNFWPLTWMPWFWTFIRIPLNFFFFIPYFIFFIPMFVWNIVPSQLQFFGSGIFWILAWIGNLLWNIVTSIFLVTIPFNLLGEFFFTLIALVGFAMNFNTMTIW